MRALLGRIVYSLFGRIIWRIELHNSRRARVIILADNGYILLTKSMVGEQKWEFPGGGVNKGEDILDAALREVGEETAIRLSKNKLKEVGSSRLTRNGATFTSHFVMCALDERREIQMEWPWLIGASWFKMDELPENMEPADRAAIKRFAP